MPLVVCSNCCCRLYIYIRFSPFFQNPIVSFLWIKEGLFQQQNNIVYMTLCIALYAADVNECNYENGGCEDICENLVGSFRCRCGPGLTLSSNRLNCRGTYWIPNPHSTCQPSSLPAESHIVNAGIPYLNMPFPDMVKTGGGSRNS